MADRMLSPSSINLYKQCPRRFFYQYILKLPTRPSIHLIRGSIVHEVLEKFFHLDISILDPDDYEKGFRAYITASLLKLWNKSKKKFEMLKLTQEELEYYLIDSQEMLNNFVKTFSGKFKAELDQEKAPDKAFHALTPIIEEEIRNPELMIRGFIDAIHDSKDHTVIIDYKTSKKDEITSAYRLQLGIYALLYKLKYGKAPDVVGINFLKFGEQTFEVDDALLDEAKYEIEFVHAKTKSEEIANYPINITPLCKWSKGQCDFYDQCIRER
ncbi:PD-(D/E)XK nuclease family protein [Candidatus Woesearchaeota archaeon]|nr:PD-(D/E)XK nuclease family protein [Candidatus Woesearchaeota archaeon]